MGFLRQTKRIPENFLQISLDRLLPDPLPLTIHAHCPFTFRHYATSPVRTVKSESIVPTVLPVWAEQSGSSTDASNLNLGGSRFEL
jgi:hypothetical protein